MSSIFRFSFLFLVVLETVSCTRDFVIDPYGPHTRPMDLSAAVSKERLSNLDVTRSGPVEDSVLPDDYTVHLSSFFNSETDASASDVYFTDKSFKKSGSVWKPEPVVFWPFGGSLNFLAVACIDGDYDVSSNVEWSEGDCTKGAVLSVSDGSCLSSEILFGRGASVGSGDTSINLKLWHSQSWLRFQLASDVDSFVRIEDIQLKNIYDGGTFKIDNTLFLSGEWNFRGHFKHDVIVPGSECLVLGMVSLYCDILLPEQSSCDIVFRFRRRSSIDQDWDSVPLESYKFPALPDPFYYGVRNVFEVGIEMTGEVSMSVNVEDWEDDNRFVTVE